MRATYYNEPRNVANMNKMESTTRSLIDRTDTFLSLIPKFMPSRHDRVLTNLLRLVLLYTCSCAICSVDTDGVTDSTPTCKYTAPDASSRLTIVIGNVVELNGARQAAILISGSKIQEIGDVDEIRADNPNAHFFECEDVYVSPGFVNAHEHPPYSGGKPGPNVAPVYTNRYQWQGKAGDQYAEIAYAAVENDAQLYWIELRHLLSGTTTLAGNGAVIGLVKNVGSGVSERGFVYEADMKTFPFPQAIEEFKGMPWPYDGPSVEPELTEGTDLQSAFVPHIAEGTDHISRLEAEFFLDYASRNPGRRYSMIHGIGLSRSSVWRLQNLDVTLIWAPRSNLILYGQTVDVPHLRENGVRVALSTDWSYSGSFNMLESFRCAKHIADQKWHNALSPQDLWLMATEHGAYALNLEQAVGALRPGLSADIVIVQAKTSDPYTDLVVSQVGDVVATLVDGTLTTGNRHAFASSELPRTCSNFVGDYFVCDDLSKRDFSWQELLAPNDESVPLFETDGQASCTF